MKKYLSLAIVGASLALAACSGNQSADYSYESQAPYGDERTVGHTKPVETQRADTVFQTRQAK